MKKVGYAFYVHKSNLNELFRNLNEIDRDYIMRVIDLARMVLFIDFEIVKFDNKTRNVSLIEFFSVICPFGVNGTFFVSGQSYWTQSQQFFRGLLAFVIYQAVPTASKTKGEYQNVTLPRQLHHNLLYLPRNAQPS